jgi:tetratricopeptide (TPR) repeat protein
MKHFRLSLVAASVLLASCTASVDKGTLADLRHVKPELSDERIEGGIEKAMAGYQKFLQETPDSAMTPEAIRRLADLKLEREYGQLENAARGRGAAAGGGSAGATATAPVTSAAAGGSATASAPLSAAALKPTGAVTAPTLAGPATAPAAPVATLAANATLAAPAKAAVKAALPVAAGKRQPRREAQKDFEQRAAGADRVLAAPPEALPEEGADLHNAGALEALALYQQLLDKYPRYERNDQVLYQMSRAYEELGRVDDAMGVMNRIAREYPRSRYLDEIQFRRGEFYFTRKKFIDAEEAYKAIVAMGEGSFYYELARYKLGWTFYKQEMQDEALHQFVALLDLKQKQGFDLETARDDFEKQRVEDTYRVISLSFSSLGGADAVTAYFDRHGRRGYEVNVYRNLGEHYLEKRRYADAAASYKAFVGRNPFHRIAPHFDMRVIEIYKQGGFPQLVIDANKEFATRYGLKAPYWTHFAVADYPDVLGYLKTNLKELANYYHALYQEKRLDKEKPVNFAEAGHWYREFLDSFPKDAEAPAMNYQLADLLLEHRAFGDAAREYERTAYDYPAHEKAAAAGYAAVYAHREHLAAVAKEGPTVQDGVKREVIRSSLRFADAFPQHDKAALVMGAALEDIYALKDYAFAVTTGRKLIATFPAAEPGLRRGAWLVVAHSSFELVQYREAEEGYSNVLQLTAVDDASRAGLTENLAAAVYKQGEQASAAADYEAAAGHFLRVGQAAPGSTIRPAADYDAATALVQLKAWDRAAEVLLDFRRRYAGHALQPEVTRKIAHVYHEAGKLTLAAAEYERIETESKDEPVRREALLFAAELYLKAAAQDNALQVYRRFIGYFPTPLEPALETRQRLADLLKARGEQDAWRKELRHIVDIDAKAGAQRTDRMRVLAAGAALTLTEPLYTQFAEIRLTQPFDKSLKKKKAAMKGVNDAFGKLVAYEVGEVTAAATYFIAEAYSNFSEALKTSERPGDLDELEREQYEEALDEQSYPFEEKAIQIHEKNLSLIGVGIYNAWVDKSLARLGVLMPGRYARHEVSSGYIAMLVNVSYVALTQPTPPPAPATPAPSAPAPAIGEAETPGATLPVNAPAPEPVLSGG